MADEQSRAEVLDDDNIGAEFPPDRPLGVDDRTADNAVVDSVAERADREVPENTDTAEPPVMVPIVDESDQYYDGEKDLVAEVEERPTGDGSESSSIASDRVPVPAEEAAIHLTDEQTEAVEP
jgi:hypothetical protein